MVDEHYILFLTLLFVATEEINDEDGLIVNGKLERVGKTPKNQAPDFFHNCIKIELHPLLLQTEQPHLTIFTTNFA